MSPDERHSQAGTHQTTLDRPQHPESSPSSEPESVAAASGVEESSALAVVQSTDELAARIDDFIDDLFDDVDRMLDHGITVAPRAEHAQTAVAAASQQFKPGALVHTPNRAIDHPPIPEDLDEPLSAFSVEPIESSPPSVWWRSLDRLLVVAACISLGLTMAVWASLQRQHSAPTVASTSAAADPNAQANADFLQYLDKALQSIDRKVADNSSGSSQTGSPTTATLPALPPPPGTSAAGSPTVPGQPLDRVYIPVYQQPQTAPATPAPAPQPAPAPASASSAPTASAASSSNASSNSGTSSADVPNVAPSTPYSLVGLLQLGDRSAAIFEFGNTAQRIGVGERIGTSGWTLVSVSDDEAIIRRNGEVRSIYVGQSF